MVGEAEALGDTDAEADGDELALAVGEGVGVITTTLGSEHPNGTDGRVTCGVGATEIPALGLGFAWITIGVSLGHGGVGGTGAAKAALKSSHTKTTTPPRMMVPMKAAAPHSCFRNFQFNDQAPSRPMLPRQRCHVSQPMLRACCCSLVPSAGAAGRR